MLDGFYELKMSAITVEWNADRYERYSITPVYSYRSDFMGLIRTVLNEYAVIIKQMKRTIAR